MGIRALPIVCVVAIAITACTRPENEDGGSSSTLTSDDTTATSSVADTTVPPTSSVPTDSTSPTSVPASTSPTTEPPTSTTGPATTAPPTTVPAGTAPPTTAAVPTSADDLTLAADGILPLRFGDRDLEVVAILTDLLGSPATDVTTDYPTADEGLFLDATGDAAFVAPFGREVCWDDGLCVHFGAGAPETRIFTGWSIAPTASGAATSTLTTEDAIGLGAILADISDSVTYDPAAACFSVVVGFARGVEITLQSGDGVFSSPNEDGSGIVLGDPDPAEVAVTQLAAGERPFFVFADC